MAQQGRHGIEWCGLARLGVAGGAGKAGRGPAWEVEARQPRRDKARLGRARQAWRDMDR